MFVFQNCALLPRASFCVAWNCFLGQDLGSGSEKQKTKTLTNKLHIPQHRTGKFEKKHQKKVCQFTGAKGRSKIRPFTVQ